MEEEEVFDLASMDQYELLSNDDGTVLIQDNCVVIKHKESDVVKMLPLSEEVLQALGLALVLDEEDMQKVQNQDQEQEVLDPPPAEAFFVKQEPGRVQYVVEPMEEEQHEEQENTSAGQGDREGFTIVFTDDEDAEKTLDPTTGDMRVGEDWKNVQQLEASDLNLPWSDGMVQLLLELYEEYQNEFISNTRNHKVLWREIYLKMCKIFPYLKTWNAGNLQSKFSGLKRMYKNIQTHNVIDGSDEAKLLASKSYAILQRIMAKIVRPDDDNAPKPDSNADSSGGGPTWKRKWTMLMLDIYESLRDRNMERNAIYAQIRTRITKHEPSFASVSVDQIRRKISSLRRTFRFYVARPDLRRGGEMKDPQLQQRVWRIFSKEPDVVDDDTPEGPKQSNWSTEQTNTFLNTCIQYRNNIQTDRSDAFKLIAKKMREHGYSLPPSVYEAKYNKMRAIYLSVVDNLDAGGSDVSWQYYKKAHELFHDQAEVWSRANTMLLLDLYAKLKQRTEDTGPKFWAQVAEMYNERRPPLSTTGRRCEARVRRLTQRYRQLRADTDTHTRGAWPYYTKMDRLFGPKAEPWPSKAINIFLAVYQRCLSRFETEDPELIWKDIAKDVNNVIEQPELVTAESCKRKMMELKDKYAKMMKDPNASLTWPPYKRMTEIFSSHLWSKANVHILLDIYEMHKERVDAGDEIDAVWNDIRDKFNELSGTSAVSAAACRTQLHVLRTRYSALTHKPHAANTWPFYDRMAEIFGEREAPPLKKMRRDFEDFSLEMDDANYCNNGENEGTETYTWTEEITNALLDLYSAHKQDFSTKSRVLVWQEIDKELQEKFPDYKPNMKGYGAWFKYLDLMTKYMDIKENRCSDNDWPYFNRVEKAVIGTPSTESSRDSIADRLQQLLEPEEPQQQAAPEPEADSPATRTRDKRKSAAAAAEISQWSTEDCILLIDVYNRNKKRFSTRNSCPQSIWTDIHRQIRFKAPKYDKSAVASQEKMNSLTYDYERQKKYGKKLASSLRLPDKIYQKMAEVMGDPVTSEEEEKPKENGITTPDSEVLQRLLEQLEKRNKQLKSKQDMLKQYHEHKLKIDKEKLAVLKKIQSACEKAVEGDESKEVTKQLMKTLQDCLEE